MHIRRARMEDCAGLARVQIDSYRAAYYLDRFTYEEQEQDWQDLLTAGGDDIMLVAESDAGEIVGYALGRPGEAEIAPYDSELMAHLAACFAHTSGRGSGANCSRR